MSSEVTWLHMVFGLAMSAVGIYFVRHTRLSKPRTERDPAGLAFGLRLYVKIGAWMFAIGGLVIALQVLLILLGDQ